jgi:hypothetical protein
MHLTEHTNSRIMGSLPVQIGRTAHCLVIHCHLDVQVIEQEDASHGGRCSQLPPDQKQSHAEVVLQMARWMGMSGKGLKAEVTGAYRVVAVSGQAHLNHLLLFRYASP